MELRLKIRGAKGLDQMLNQLPNEVATKIADRALKQAANVIEKEIEQRIPRRTGKLKRQVKDIKVNDPNQLRRIVRVGLFGRAAGVGHMLEYGTVPIRLPKGDKKLRFVINGKVFYRSRVKGVSARPFMRPAIAASTERALQVLGDTIASGIINYAQSVTRQGE